MHAEGYKHTIFMRKKFKRFELANLLDHHKLVNGRQLQSRTHCMFVTVVSHI